MNNAGNIYASGNLTAGTIKSTEQLNQQAESKQVNIFI